MTNKKFNKKCVMIVSNPSKTHVLLIKEHYTNQRLKEWAQWDDWKPIDLYKHISGFNSDQVAQLDIPVKFKQLWIDILTSNNKITHSNIKQWIIDGLEFPSSILEGLGKWGLPKGSLETGEYHNTIKCAYRELTEEVGLTHDDFNTIDFITFNKQYNAYIYLIKLNAYILNTSFNIGPEVSKINWFNIDTLKANLSFSKFNQSVYMLHHIF